MNTIEASGYECFIVGGSVRDSLLGETPFDFDITTNALPDEIKRILSGFRTVDTGLRHGTVTVISEEHHVEVTTYRIDGTYSDNRRPDSVIFTPAVRDDLSRRDFTINAMAYNPQTGFIDLFGGEADIFSRNLTCVGNPRERFREDALRILRALRFASTLNFTIEQNTANAIHDLSYTLKNISKERIAKEFERLLCGSNVYNVLTQFSDTVTQIIPEFEPCIGFLQHSKYHIYDVWEHTVKALSISKPYKSVRLALLFHDIAKPECFKLDKANEGHFSGHSKIGALMTEKILRNLKFDNQTINTVSKLVRYHYITPVAERKFTKKLLSEIGFDLFVPLMEVIRADNLAKNSFCFERAEAAQGMLKIAEDVVRNNECHSVSMLEIDGTEIALTGASGRNIGRILEALLTEVIAEKIPNENAALNTRAREIYEVFCIGNAKYG
jgi:tRNA nucleotidyltransferase (CCA-adding enzyme)